MLPRLHAPEHGVGLSPGLAGLRAPGLEGETCQGMVQEGGLQGRDKGSQQWIITVLGEKVRPCVIHACTQPISHAGSVNDNSSDLSHLRDHGSVEEQAGGPKAEVDLRAAALVTRQLCTLSQGKQARVSETESETRAGRWYRTCWVMALCDDILVGCCDEDTAMETERAWPPSYLLPAPLG